MDDQNLVYYEGYGTRPWSLRAHGVNCCLEPDGEIIFRFLFALFECLDDPDRERVLPSPCCGNVSLSRHRRYTRAINALRAYLGRPPVGPLLLDDIVLSQLGEPNPAKRWLVASLEKTLREQLPSAPEPA